ncbi:MAG: hypothetical protein M3N18_07595 [Actinomycetota bacterium]|nr:hypothetical protein [Actinomycetota bacterium]
MSNPGFVRSSISPLSYPIFEDLLPYLRLLFPELLGFFLRFLSGSSPEQTVATSNANGHVGAIPSGSWSQTMSAFGSPPVSPVTEMLFSDTPASSRA